MKNLLMGIDIGTSACKIAIFDRGGHVLASADRDYKVYYPAAGFAEQNPAEWYDAVCAGIRDALAKGRIPAGDIAGIGVDGQSWSAIAVDKSGRLLCNTPIWMDTRAAGICGRVNEKIGAARIFELSGNSFEPMYTTPKILWYKENRPDVYKNTYKILQSNAYIVYCLTGKMTQDVCQSYGLHVFNMSRGVYDERMCDEMGIPREFLPEISGCSNVVGEITQKAAEETGLAAGTPVVAGGLDAACGTLGAGVIQKGQTQEQGGQAGGMSICLEEYRPHPKLIMSYHVVPDRWLLQGGTVGGGGALKWFREQLGGAVESSSKSGRNVFQMMDEEAAEIHPGADGLVFLPYMAGERSPIWDKHAKGILYGLDYTKTRAHIIRAIMEGVAFSLRHNLETAENTGATVEKMHAMGGAANSSLWTQIKADVTGKVMKVPASDTATCMGAAILAGVGTGIYQSFDDAVNETVHIKKTYLPDLSKSKKYQANYVIYRELYEKLKETMRKSHLRD